MKYSGELHFENTDIQMGEGPCCQAASPLWSLYLTRRLVQVTVSFSSFSVSKQAATLRPLHFHRGFSTF